MVTRRTRPDPVPNRWSNQTRSPSTHHGRTRVCGAAQMRDREGFWNRSGAEDRGRPRPTEVQIKQTQLSAQVDQTASL